MILIFLSLQVVASLLPTRFQETLWIRSGWQSISTAHSPVDRFQIQIKGSALALRSTLLATGCHWIFPTFLWWGPFNSRSGLSRFWVSPPSGISQIFTEVSSDDEAIMLSSKGFHARSSTSWLCPVTRGAFMSTRPVWKANRLWYNSVSCNMLMQNKIRIGGLA